MYHQKIVSRKKWFFCVLNVKDKNSRNRSQRHGSADPDPCQNVRIHKTDRYTIQMCQIQTYMNAKVQR
jgi:hypothetical protein